MTCDMVQERSTVSTVNDNFEEQRRAVIALCLPAFTFVDAEKTGNVNANGCKTAVTLVFNALSEKEGLRMPDDAWFVKVFKNFDEDQDGLLDFESFQEIVVQYWEHSARRAKARVETGSAPQARPMEISKMSPSAKRSPAVQVNNSLMYPTYNGRLAVFDDYDFFGMAGSGGFGKVMIVRHKKLQAVRACKSIAVQTQLQRDLVETEIELLRRLNHPNIMRLFESYREGHNLGGNVYLIVELCEGGDLFSRILHHYTTIRTPMTEAQVSYYMQQILSAMQYCHTRRPSPIIHRDLKPENMLFVNRTATSPLKVIDFGLANFRNRIAEAATEVKQPKKGVIGTLARTLPKIGSKQILETHTRRRMMQRAGTAPYMAPEMILGEYDEKVDVFSVGAILYQLMTGKHPFYEPGIDDEATVRKKISSPEPVSFPPELWAGVSADAVEFTRNLLDKNPAKRPSATDALNNRWIRDDQKPSPFGNKSALSISIFEGLQRYQEQNKLKRAVLQLLAKDLSEHQIQSLRRKFLALDTRGDGLLSADQLAKGMQECGYPVKEHELEMIMETLDPNSAGVGQGRIGYNEFIAALMERRVKIDMQQLRECFSRLDREGKGRISLRDAQEFLLGTASQVGITASEWTELEPGEGGIDFEQFCMLVKPDDQF